MAAGEGVSASPRGASLEELASPGDVGTSAKAEDNVYVCYAQPNSRPGGYLPRSFLRPYIMACQHKVVLLGAADAGKSSIVLRLVNDRFDPYPESTIGAAFAMLKLEDGGVHRVIGVWDTAGQERYEALAPMYYRNAQLALIVYDVTSDSSFDRAIRWIKDISKLAPSLSLVLVGTKTDLQTYRTVSEEEGSDAAGANTYIEVSSKTGANFHLIRETLLEHARRLSTRTPLELGDPLDNANVGVCC